MGRALSKKDPTNDRIDPNGPGYVDSDVAGEIPHKINTIAETGESARVQHRIRIGVEDLNSFGSSSCIPIHGVEGERMGVAVGEIDVKAERAIAVPGCGNSPGTIPGLQSSRINGARSPSVVKLIFNGQGSIAWDALRVVGHGISIGSVNAMPVALRRGIGGDKARGCFRSAATAGSSKKDAADYRIDPTSPGYVDSDVAGEIPHKINTIAETGESPRVEHRTGVGINDLNGFGSYDRVPVHGVQGELMGVAVGQIDVKAKRAIAIPGCRNSPGTIPGLQSSRINGARSPRVVQLIFDGQGSIAWDALRVVGHGISIGPVNAMPVALRRGIGSDKAGRGLRTATAGTSKEDAADYRIDPTSPGYVDSNVAGEIPDQINTITETGESPRVEHRTGVGINDLNGFGSCDRVPVHGVEGERMGVAVGEIDVKAERAIAVPGCGNSPGTIPGLQSSRINGARSPRVVQLIFDGQGSIAWDAL